ncbi:MAG TPA: Mur ligase domain-containing protein, partial [Acidimicrobiia bacterium]|nr:Mur ligase domain-containing protein [Acidimicrobiia bacterium]
MSLDLSEPRRVHIVGVGGMAMSGIAAVLTRLGHTVSGSDLKTWRGLERLRFLGVDVHVPHDAACLPAELDAVVISTAIPATNPEVVAARERGVPVLRRAEALAAIV